VLRLPRFAALFLVSVVGCIAMSYVLPGFSWTSARTGYLATETHAPAAPDDSVWQPAAQAVIATNDSASEIRKEQVRGGSFVPADALSPTASLRSHEHLDAARDRSPQHSIPLLI
jgi:hypothetical protein